MTKNKISRFAILLAMMSMLTMVIVSSGATAANAASLTLEDKIVCPENSYAYSIRCRMVIETGKMEVTGEGDFPPDTYINDARIKELKVGKGITGICGNAFSNCSNLRKVSLPETLTKIGGEVFAGCKSLKYINIPNSVESVEDGFLFDCQDAVIYCSENTYVQEYLNSIGFYDYDGDGYYNHSFLGPPIEIRVGDADLNGKTNVNDVTLIQKYSVRMVTFTEEQIAQADVNKDHRVDITDATLVQMIIAGLTKEMPTQYFYSTYFS